MMTEAQPSSARAWVVTFAALGINLMGGIIYAWSVLSKAMGSQWGWTKTQGALPFAMATASFAIMMIFAGRLQDRIGPRRVAMLGGVMLGLGYMLSSLVRTPGLMMLTMSVVGIGLGLAYSATTPAAIKWFAPGRKGLITGIVVSGVGLAAVYASPLAQFLLKQTSIENTFLILGIGCLVVVCLSSILVVNPPAGHVPAPAAARGSAGPVQSIRFAGRNLDWHEMLKTAQFYFLWLMFVLSASAGLMIISNITQIADLQAQWKNGFLAVMLLAIFNTAGRFVSGFVSDRIGRTYTMILFFLLQAANMFAFVHYTSPALIMIGAAVTGLSYGTIYTLFPAATADFYGVRNLGVNYGFVFTAFGVAGVSGSLLGGRVADIFKNYQTAYTVSGIMLLVGVVLALATRAPKEARQT